MANLVLGTTVVSMDEAGFNLSEVNLQSPGSRGWHRYQLITVWRNEKPYEACIDLGPSKNFTTHQFNIPAGVMENGRFVSCHTVGELMDIADYLRAGFYEAPEYKPKTASEFLIDYQVQRDKDALRRSKRSTFGAKVAIQRS